MAQASLEPRLGNVAVAWLNFRLGSVGSGVLAKPWQVKQTTFGRGSKIVGAPLPLLFIFPCVGHFKASAMLTLFALNFTEFSGPLLVFRMSDYSKR